MAAVTDVPGKAPTRKVLAGAGGAGFGVATADLVCWALAALFIDGEPLPVQVSTWINLALPILLALAAGYLMPRSIEEVAPFRPRGDHEAH